MPKSEPVPAQTSAGAMRAPIGLEEALARLEIVPDYDPGSGRQPCVHTFLESPIGLIGAHWTLEAVRAAIERYGCEEAGPNATALGHGLVIKEPVPGLDNRWRTVFLATKPPGRQTPRE